MNKLIFMLLLAVLSSSAMAKWVELEAANFDNKTTYVDPSSIRKTGNIVTMSFIWDFKTAQTYDDKQFMSVKIQEEYNCKKEQFRMVHQSLHSEPMDTGQEIFSKSYSDNKFEPISGSAHQSLLRMACG